MSGSHDHTCTLGATFSLFLSAGTLVCCALPALLVTVGLGAAVAATVSAAPWLAELSAHKAWLFAVSGLLIGANLAYMRLAPAPPAQSCSTCRRSRVLSRRLLFASAIVWSVGIFVAYPLAAWISP